MPVEESIKNFKDELNGFIKELNLWIPLIRILVIPEEQFQRFWENFSKLHEEKKIYSSEVVDRMKKVFLKLRRSEEDCCNLNDNELKELLSFAASHKYTFL